MKELTTMEAAAALMLDELERGKSVRLDIQAEDASTAGLMRLIRAVHEQASKRRVAITMELTDERTIRLSVAA